MRCSGLLRNFQLDRSAVQRPVNQLLYALSLYHVTHQAVRGGWCVQGLCSSSEGHSTCNPTFGQTLQEYQISIKTRYKALDDPTPSHTKLDPITCIRSAQLPSPTSTLVSLQPRCLQARAPLAALSQRACWHATLVSKCALRLSVAQDLHAWCCDARLQLH